MRCSATRAGFSGTRFWLVYHFDEAEVVALAVTDRSPTAVK